MADPRTLDVAHLAGIRWYSLSIERIAMELYITHPEQFPAMNTVLKRHLAELEAMVVPKQPIVPTYEECATPWVMCDDGICRMRCDGV